MTSSEYDTGHAPDDETLAIRAFLGADWLDYDCLIDVGNGTCVDKEELALRLSLAPAVRLSTITD